MKPRIAAFLSLISALASPAVAQAPTSVVCPDGQRPYFGICPGGAEPVRPTVRPPPSPGPRVSPPAAPQTRGPAVSGAPGSGPDRWERSGSSRCTFTTPGRSERDGRFRVIMDRYWGSSLRLELDGSLYASARPGTKGSCDPVYRDLTARVALDGKPAGLAKWVGGSGCGCSNGICGPAGEHQTLAGLSVERGLGNLPAQLGGASEISFILTNGKAVGRRFGVSTAGLKPLIDQCLATP